MNYFLDNIKGIYSALGFAGGLKGSSFVSGIHCCQEMNGRGLASNPHIPFELNFATAIIFFFDNLSSICASEADDLNAK
jgi:hypothetical protein